MSLRKSLEDALLPYVAYVVLQQTVSKLHKKRFGVVDHGVLFGVYRKRNPRIA